MASAKSVIQEEEKQLNNQLLGFFSNFGQVGIPVPFQERDDFVSTINSSVQMWFQQHVAEAFGEIGDIARRNTLAKRKSTSPQTARADAAFDKGKRAWTLLSAEAKSEILQPFDLSTLEGQKLMFSNKARKKLFEDEDYGPYVNKQLRFALNGSRYSNCGSNVGGSWAESGFGIWAHLHAALSQQLAFRMQFRMWDLFVIPLFIGGMSTMIYKPPGGKGLKCHHDQLTPTELIRACESNITSSPSNPNLAWLQTHGIQSLVHITGSRVDGHTFTISPMCPWRLLILQLLLRREHVHSGLQFADLGQFLNKYWRPKLGPNFMAWDDTTNLKVANRVIQAIQNMREASLETGVLSLEFPQAAVTTKEDRTWLESVTKHHNKLLTLLVKCASPLPKDPMTVTRIRNFLDPTQSSFLAIWPVGFPHGSLPNPSEGRLTLAPKFSATALLRKDAERFIKRLRQVTELAHGETEAIRSKAEKWLKDDKQKYEDGPAHMRTITEIELMRQDGPFQSLALTRQQMSEFETHVLEEVRTGVITPASSGVSSGVLSAAAASSSRISTRLASTSVAPALSLAEVAVAIPWRSKHDTPWSKSAKAARSVFRPPRDVIDLTADGTDVAATPCELEESEPPREARPPQARRPQAIKPRAREPREPRKRKVEELKFRDIRLLNIKQPWANVVVRGIKNVENRRKHIYSTLNFPTEWVMIVASKSKPEKADLSSLQFKLDALHRADEMPTHFALGAIVGMVKFVDSTTHSTSIWYNGAPDIAWVIGDAISFVDRPIPNVVGSQGPLVTLENHSQRDYIISELQQLVSDDVLEDMGLPIPAASPQRRQRPSEKQRKTPSAEYEIRWSKPGKVRLRRVTKSGPKPRFTEFDVQPTRTPSRLKLKRKHRVVEYRVLSSSADIVRLQKIK